MLQLRRRVMASAAAGIKRVTLELGGSDPMIVCDDGDIDEAAKAAAVGAAPSSSEAKSGTLRKASSVISGEASVDISHL